MRQTWAHPAVSSAFVKPVQLAPAAVAPTEVASMLYGLPNLYRREPIVLALAKAFDQPNEAGLIRIVFYWYSNGIAVEGVPVLGPVERDPD